MYDDRRRSFEQEWCATNYKRQKTRSLYDIDLLSDPNSEALLRRWIGKFRAMGHLWILFDVSEYQSHAVRTTMVLLEVNLDRLVGFRINLCFVHSIFSKIKNK
jgi:hypothetical protein